MINCSRCKNEIDKRDLIFTNGDYEATIKISMSRFDHSGLYLSGGRMLCNKCAEYIDNLFWERPSGIDL